MRIPKPASVSIFVIKRCRGNMCSREVLSQSHIYCTYLSPCGLTHKSESP